MVCLETLEGRFHLAPELAGVLGDGFRGEEYLLAAAALERFAHDFLVAPLHVDPGGVYVVDAVVDGRPDKFGIAHVHGAEPDFAHLAAGGTQLTVRHPVESVGTLCEGPAGIQTETGERCGDRCASGRRRLDEISAIRSLHCTSCVRSVPAPTRSRYRERRTVTPSGNIDIMFGLHTVLPPIAPVRLRGAAARRAALISL